MSRVEFPDPDGPPVIVSRHGRTSESARLAAAANMAANHELREQIIAMIAIEQRLGYADAVKETKRRYPEAWMEVA